MAGEDKFNNDNPPPPPPITPTQQAPHTLSTIKLPILKKGEDDIWAMKMKHYLGLTDYPIWEVIQKGNGPVQVSTDTNGQIRVLPPKTAEEILDRERERKARTALLMSILKDHLEKFHKMADAKDMWEAIKSRFSGNDESKKMQKYILKQQFESFYVSNSEGLHKGYDRFQSLLSQLKIHGAGISTEDANQKFLRSLLASWSQVSLIMRTKPGVDTLSFDDLYNNLRVFESNIKGSTASSSSTQNVTFVSSESTISTNDVSTAYVVSTSSGHSSQKEGSSLYSDELKRDGFEMASGHDFHEIEEVLQEDREKAVDEPNALVILDGDGTDWTGHAEDEQENFALMAYSNSGSNTEVTSCSKECEESYAKLKKLYDKQREQLGVASIEIQAYTQALKKMSTRDKSGLGYGNQIHEGVLSYEKEVLESVFDSRSSDVEDSPVYDRFAKVEGMHAVPPPMTGNYMPPKSDFGIDESNFTYGPKQSKTSESDAKTSDFDSCETNSSVETLESVPEPVVVEPKVVSQPKVWSDAPIIEEYESDSDDEYVIEPLKEQEKPSFAFVNTVKHVKTPRETVKEQNTCSPSPKANKRDWNGLMSKKLGLGYGFTKKACFVCGSFSHLIRDCDFHEKRMAKQVELNKKKGKGTGQEENRPVWNNVQRLNHQNKFVPKAVLTKTGIFPVNAARQNPSSQAAKTSTARKVNTARLIDDPQKALKNKRIVDSGCSKHMTGNKAYLVEYQDYNGGLVAFGGSKGYISGKGKKWKMCDKKNKVLFTDTECLVLSPDFKLPDENQVLLRVPRQNNMYSFNLENIVPTGGLACLIAKATVDESNKWHRRLGHVNFKNLNKLVKGNLVRGLPSKIFQNDHTCVACQKGKQHKASCKAKLVSSISQPLQLLHMDLFGPTSVRSINHKTYCLVITDDFSRFSWVFFLRTKDETGGILKDFIRQIKNQLNQKVKTIRCDNGTKFKNMDIIEFCGSKGIKREYSNARTPQQNRVAERKNRTLIEATRTMLADSFLPNTFWAEAVSTTCYVLNRVLVTKPQNKTPYELITGKIPIISYIRPFGCHVTILNTIDHLGKFEEKSDEGFLVGYSLNSKAFRVYNLETKRVEENLHINFLENKPNVAGKGPNWLFDLDYLTDSMNYQPITVENKANKTTSPKEANHSAVKSSKTKNGDEKPNGDTDLKTTKEPKDQEDQAFLEELKRLKIQEKEANDAAEAFTKEFAQCTEDLLLQTEAARATSTNTVNTVSIPISIGSPSNVFSTGGPNLNDNDQDDSQIPALEDIYDNPSDGIFTNASYDDEGAVADFTNLETTVNVSPIPTSRIHSIHPTTQILRYLTSAVQTRSKVHKSSGAHAFVSYIQKQRRNNHKDFQHYLFACFLSQIEPKKISQALEDEIRNKARLVSQGYRQEEGIDYDKVFAPVAKIEAIRIFLAFASYMGFIVYQMDVKSAFLYGTIDEEVYMSQPLEPDMLLYLLSCRRVDTEEEPLTRLFSTRRTRMISCWYRFLMSSMRELTFFLGLQVKQKEDGIFINQDKYVAEILKKFDFASVKTANTTIETQKSLTKDEEAANVDVHLYRSMIGSLMYLTASIPDIMFAVYACSRVSSFDLEAYSDSDYAGANLDRKSTTGGCQFLGRRLIDGSARSRQLWLLLLHRQMFHPKTKHIEIRHHFIRDAYEKKLIQVLKIHTDDNVADLLTKAFDVSRFNFLIVNIRMLNL
ncbi:putative ribonuclease H-like domain-containing protein [Tanacetum coccineum]